MPPTNELMPDILIKPKVETDGPPPPKSKAKWPEPKRVNYDLLGIPVGSSARFNKSHHTLIRAVFKFRQNPENKKYKFIIRPITKKLCRVWRLK